MNGTVVAGGGPAGAAVAALLAGSGREVLVLERDPGPADKVCGDFLSVEAQQSLSELGLDLSALSPSPIRSVRLMHRQRVAEAALPFPALGLSRRALDAALLDLAAARGAAVRRGVKVQSLSRQGSALTLVTGDGEFRPHAVFLATGKHELRGAARAVQAPRSVGFKTYLSLAPEQTGALRGVVEVLLFEGGYAGLLLVEADAANLSLVVSADRLARAGGTWDGLLASLQAECALLARRLSGATPLRPRPLAISRLPYGFIHAPGPGDLAGVYRLGDQAAVIPSLTGDGVSIALHTARRGAEALLSGRSASDYHAGLRRDLRGQMLRASLVHRACLTRALQPSVLRVCRAVPAIMRLAAAWTRIAATTREPLTPTLSRKGRGSGVPLPLREGLGEG